MKPAKTLSSVKLRAGPARQYAVVDSLEQDYPLIVHDIKDGWYKVTAKAHGLRSQDQDGWIDSRFVVLVPFIIPDRPPPLDHPQNTWLRTPEWWQLGAIATFLVFAGLLWLSF